MPPVPKTTGIVYRRGGLTGRNFTPREDDLEGEPGAAAGLSTNESLPQGVKGHAIDLALLPPGLRAFADDPAEAGGEAGHVSIVPVNPQGEIDHEALERWAQARESGEDHPLTQLLLEAVVEKNVRGPV